MSLRPQRTRRPKSYPAAEGINKRSAPKRANKRAKDKCEKRAVKAAQTLSRPAPTQSALFPEIPTYPPDLPYEDSCEFLPAETSDLSALTNFPADPTAGQYPESAGDKVFEEMFESLFGGLFEDKTVVPDTPQPHPQTGVVYSPTDLNRPQRIIYLSDPVCKPVTGPEPKSVFYRQYTRERDFSVTVRGRYVCHGTDRGVTFALIARGVAFLMSAKHACMFDKWSRAPGYQTLAPSVRDYHDCANLTIKYVNVLREVHTGDVDPIEIHRVFSTSRGDIVGLSSAVVDAVQGLNLFQIDGVLPGAHVSVTAETVLGLDVNRTQSTQIITPVGIMYVPAAEYSRFTGSVAHAVYCDTYAEKTHRHFIVRVISSPSGAYVTGHQGRMSYVAIEKMFSSIGVGITVTMIHDQ